MSNIDRSHFVIIFSPAVTFMIVPWQFFPIIIWKICPMLPIRNCPWNKRTTQRQACFHGQKHKHCHTHDTSDPIFTPISNLWHSSRFLKSFLQHVQFTLYIESASWCYRGLSWKVLLLKKLKDKTMVPGTMYTVKLIPNFLSRYVQEKETSIVTMQWIADNL